MKSKFLAEAHKDQLDWEKNTLDAYQEKTHIDLQSCNHSKDKLFFRSNSLNCKECGMRWHGTGRELEDLYNLLTEN